MSMSVELMKMMSSSSLMADYFLWLRTEYLCLRGRTLFSIDFSKVVRKGELEGGKKSFIFLRGLNMASDIQ